MQAGRSASRVLPKVPKIDRGVALEIAFGCLRLRARIDARIRRCADRRLTRIDGDVLDWLRIGAYQLAELGIPAHAAVGETVRAARTVMPRGRAGYINGVLRSLARRAPEEDLFPSLDSDPVAHLSIWGSHPEWLVRRWLKRWSRSDVLRLVEHDNAPPGVVARMLDPSHPPEPPPGVEVEPVAGWPRSYALTKGSPAEALAGLRAVIQDPAASAVVDYVGSRPARPVVDACAAPGTKAAGLSATYGVPVLALDKSRRRLSRVGESARRLGLPLYCAVADARRLPVAGAGTILADVPCTGTGALRRRADARWRLGERRLGEAIRLQREIIDACATAVRPGGILVYSTCSLEREENEEQVDAFLNRRPDFEREPPAEASGEAAGPASVQKECLTSCGDLFVRPWLTGTDGAYAARLRRR